MKMFIYDRGFAGAIVVLATSLEEAMKIAEEKFPDDKWSYYSVGLPDPDDEDDMARWSEHPIEHGAVCTTRGDC